jgi:hypothetical protein
VGENAVRRGTQNSGGRNPLVVSNREFWYQYPLFTMGGRGVPFPSEDLESWGEKADWDLKKCLLASCKTF